MKRVIWFSIALILGILLAGCSVQETSAPAAPITQVATASTSTVSSTLTLTTTTTVTTTTTATTPPPSTPLTPQPTAIPTYTWQEAVNHIGEKATVTGPVIDWIDWETMPMPGASGETQLGLGKSWQDASAFVVALWVPKDKLPEGKYKGTTIAVTGIITKPQGWHTGQRIDVNDLSQITVVSDAPAGRSAS